MGLLNSLTISCISLLVLSCGALFRPPACMPVNQLLLGDNLEILRSLDSDSVDLIYLDPPFFSNRTYEVIWGDKGEVRSFEDRFSGGIDHYIAWLKERVEEMHRVLKSTGSIFLHCDDNADSHIRVSILDKVFDSKKYRGKVIWQRHNAHNDAKKKLADLTDIIWYYTKSKKLSENSYLSLLSIIGSIAIYKADSLLRVSFS